MNELRVTKIVKEVKFGRGRGELETETCFQRESLTKYLRPTLVFMRNSTLR